MDNKPKVYLYGANETELRIIRLIALRDPNVYIFPASSKEQIPGMVAGAYGAFETMGVCAHKHIVIIDTHTTDPCAAEEIVDTYKSLIRQPVLLCFFNPDVYSVLNVPEEFRNEKEISDKLIQWIKDNQNELRENSNIFGMMRFVMSDDERKLDNWKNLPPDLKGWVVTLTDTVSGFMKDVEEMDKRHPKKISDKVLEGCQCILDDMYDRFGKENIK